MSQVLTAKPIVRNKDGIVVWQADDTKFHYHDESAGKDLFCTWLISGGVVIVRNPCGEVVEAVPPWVFWTQACLEPSRKICR